MHLYLATMVLTDNSNYHQGVKFGEMILKEQLRQEISFVCGPTTKVDPQFKEKKCPTLPLDHQDTETSLYVFMSFSVPDETWLMLSEEIIRYRGIIILKGLPGNSFKELAFRINALRSRGMKAPVQIDPNLFVRFGVDSVPSFVKINEESFNKISGNFSLEFALEKIE